MSDGLGALFSSLASSHTWPPWLEKTQAWAKGDLGLSGTRNRGAELDPHSGSGQATEMPGAELEAGRGPPAKAVLEWAGTLGSGQHPSFSHCFHQKEHV